MQKQIYGKDAAHPGIAKSLNNLGTAWCGKSDYDKAVEYFEESLAMKKQIYAQGAAHPHIANTYKNLRHAWNRKGDYDKVVE